MGMAFLIAQFTYSLGPADLDSLHRMGNNHFLFSMLLTDLVIPDFHFDTTVELSPFFCRIAGNWPAVAKPFIGDGFGGKIQRTLAIPLSIHP